MQNSIGRGIVINNYYSLKFHFFIIQPIYIVHWSWYWSLRLSFTLFSITQYTSVNDTINFTLPSSRYEREVIITKQRNFEYFEITFANFYQLHENTNGIYIILTIYYIFNVLQI